MRSLSLICFVIVPFLATVSNQYDVKVGMMLPKNALKNKIGFGTSAGAVTIALRRILKEQLLPGANFSFVWLFTECHEMQAMHSSVDLFVLEDVDVILGPACSIEAVMTGIMGGSYNKVLVTWAATASELIVEERFPTLVSPIGTADSLGRGLVELLNFFNWHRIAILYNDDLKAERKCHYVILDLQKRLRSLGTNIQLVLSMKGADRIVSSEEMDSFLIKMSEVARIAIVCLDAVADRRKFMLKVHDKGLNTDEYMYILPDYLPDFNRSKVWIDYSSTPDGRDQHAKEAFEKTFVVEFKTLDDVALHEFKKEVPKIMEKWPFYYKSAPDEVYGSTFSPFLHDAMYLYALCLNKTLMDGKAKNDGRAVFDNARSARFRGMSGDVVIDPWSIREPNFIVKGFDNTRNYKELVSLNMDKPLGQAVILEMAAWKLWANRQGGTRPLDTPKCGWMGELCVQSSSHLFVWISVAASLVVLISLAAVVILIYMR